jgi:hypothetical protein
MYCFISESGAPPLVAQKDEFVHTVGNFHFNRETPDARDERNGP